MVMIGSDELVRVFSERTFANLEYIEKAKQNGDSVYEATQLINSLLGLIIFPKEHTDSIIPNKPLDELKNWPLFDDCEDLNDFIRLFRNAIAHCNIQLLGNDKIEGIRFENKNRQGITTWEQNFSLDEIRSIANKLYDLMYKKQNG
ncbi:hypothetical protein D0S45_14405 [Marinifilum sp. JC120]|nr:hypothetical protein D0S45_14405 [Marinifilum sp. JC120]